ncbi:S-adenosyl-L-methionine-dependent tRNA 4-demethylwyosine synthase TYW1 isoform X1 [Canis lupus baileyi]|uniref:S-adenosyl-L-methionine-dependent tRNA 4-demethylwyosine synthase TYW1 n=5 Tax=Canis lupus familiaris TaxID=9615 RepID=A0A8C0Q8T5_CANLF|nr:S-adenosyl-L-methionine-dependent tRNA 4-demethylwyosine synthase TYW1 isoform X1 [Canis lupus familiaris]XP_035574061.1 S-adenosyl-L-methionine-dependent tRNA 4-demethylwyosine synthase TYW1 isoform X1 [Canis lupus dingo]XP_038394933.1 S-adenosyl-L-methionine-dependent tRNA 4-demethylwyosine synthase TYW1 isoform X1 [Canis lupus familiaris]XP_038523733.1 S-adenosyl-L-methionine-dependent tRNA 4-demethylwyosine synthase TYW1 isoform X1 [Canis lupus familiaris]|eukprot:XP_005620987.1 S-adenosyl-L-methionine-dependent tRNA 4-demethylwyosine synthase isoform X1 [Canis lupus familiaris]
MDPFSDTWDFSSPVISLWINRFYIYLGFAFGISLWICFQIVIRKQLFILKGKKSQEKSVPKATGDLMTNGCISLQNKEVFVSGVKIFYGSQTGTAKGFATSLAEAVTSLDLPVAVINLKEYDPDDQLVEEVTSKNVCAFVVATYTDGQPTESAVWFCKWLEEASSDFRFGKTYLKGMRYAVFGLGNSVYASHFNKVGKNVDKWLWMLGAHRVVARGEGDCDVVKSKHGSIEADFRVWKTKFLARLQALQKGEKKPCDGNCKRGQCESSVEEEPSESTSEEESGTEDHQNLNSVVDVEDLGKIMNCVKKEKREKEEQEEKSSLVRNTVKNEDSERRTMITPALREALTKQGYQLIGSHSGVKLCRWTKSMLRGRGGCYKHTFYGIESHRCMETTPSLACANKCVFCWRHHTNPVGTEWRWKMDQPEMILKEAIENHQNMIKQFKGVPGVKEERFEEAMMVKHCALSLVGEPIMYPEINRFLKLLHECKISSFLVTNAQFPLEIRNLKPVTQLYVSVDASTKDSLKKIDRPLFKDFWQRFLNSLKALAAKQQRTVYRLTLVKAWNVDELQAYAELVSLGNPDFIEVKGVTYCGESSASSLTMANVPWHEEVIHFVRELVDLIPDYEIACEHEHSNCLLIAHKRFKIGREWWTWIDYNRFQELVQGYEDSGGSATFSAEDYMAKTPHWALFGASERGFDPKDTRYQRKNKSKDISGC